MKKKNIKFMVISIAVILLLLAYLILDYFKYGHRIEDIPGLYNKIEEYIPNLYESKYGKYIENYKTFVSVGKMGMYKFFDEIHVYVVGTFANYYVEDNKLWTDSTISRTYKIVFKNNEIVGYLEGQYPKHIIKAKRQQGSIIGSSEFYNDDYVEKVKAYYGEELYNTIFTNKIEMSIKEGTLSNSEATVIIKDNNIKQNLYGNWFRIDKKVGEEWKELIPINENYIFTKEAIATNENNVLELETNWLELYGKLENGEYRLVKELYGIGNEGKYFWVEFEIE